MYAVEFRNITKKFPGIIANDKVSFQVEKGTIHALIGENGAGKSTLMSILFGLYEQTSGEILINGNKVLFSGPNDANALGIGMVHQHFKLVDVYTNLENIILGEEWANAAGVINRDIAIKKIKSLQNKYNLQFDLFQKSGDATVSTQQKVEIMKMLYRGNDILVFDEPTAVLTDEEIQGLLKSFEIFKKAGKTIIFISHKLKEIQQVADTATVLRLGKVAGNFVMAQTSLDEIIKAMVGNDVVEIKNNIECKKENVVFSIKNLTTTKLKKNLKNINFNIHAGEIFAIAGVAGNGQEELEYVVGGMEKPQKGSIHLRTFNSTTNSYELTDITRLGAQNRSKLHMSYIPADRHHHGMILDFTIHENAAIRRLWDKQFQSSGVLRNKNIAKFTQEIIDQYDVRSSQGAKSIARSLSGGNQQKFIVGREMKTEHDFIIIVQPTRGMDIGAITNIHTQILEEKAKGKAILLISYELDEVLALADTIAVINEGKILSINDSKGITREQIGKFMSASSGESDNWFNPNDFEDSKDSYISSLHKKYAKLNEQALLKEASIKSSLMIVKKSKDADKSVINELNETLAQIKNEKVKLAKEYKSEMQYAKNSFEQIYDNYAIKNVNSKREEVDYGKQTKTKYDWFFTQSE
ncbi:ABC transporter [Mycoplasmopsis californica HAZ160_1]|uniref:ABC transporter ATP-binding protein n=2 Tax=Mycoplasmopsis californica TaxID=2113 RepID=A0A059XR32_9BACT|nr:ABC transporter ATP-binding protein [Mycoplasmopsis californica]AIA29510.1 ABC transporter ATP-binding protein [Mycoplasmopsis californica]BAP01046.1 ABC transporter [Mycoplasmopsis californica HAZ160_1]BBG40911.1 ABC transporter [Mycoplasmopsis californica]BBG41505.1 ABC transporter [Mycoplasmopsis californica]BBG42098.1 ABC transporter [Mycoplasmopsis californica]